MCSFELPTCERTKGSLAPCLVAARSPGGLLETPPRWQMTLYYCAKGGGKNWPSSWEKIGPPPAFCPLAKLAPSSSNWVNIRDRSLFMAGGGAESKVGGASKIFWGSKSRHRKKIKKPWVGVEKIPYQKSSPLAQNLLTTSITLSHELKICTMCTFVLL